MVESKHQWKAWLYLAPAIVLLLVFTVWPIINTVRLAFLNDYNSLSEVGGATFTVGIKNFQTVIGDSGFKTALKNTIYSPSIVSTVFCISAVSHTVSCRTGAVRISSTAFGTATPDSFDSSLQQLLN